jgi:hypothetical protein
VDCPNCRVAVDDGARFCPSCGTVVDGDAPADGTAVMEAVSVADEQDDAGGRTASDREQPAPSGELRTCPACGADNSAARMLCARCGVDLDSGERPVAAPVVHRPGPAVDVAGDVTPTGRGNRTALVVAVIVVVGAIVGVLVGLWVVDAGQTPEAAAPTFDAGVYTDEPQTLEVTAVGASSERPAAGQTTYDAANLVDDDVTTAWSHDPAVEAAADVDLALALADPAWVTALTFANGAQADDLAFTDDGRVLRLMLLVDGSGAAELQLLDQPGLQRVTLPQPVLVDTIRLVVLEAVPGDTYDEVSMSEIVVTGHPARGEDLSRAISGGSAPSE